MKDVSSQQVTEHLKRLNPWWGTGRMDEETRKLRPRAYLEPVQRLLLDARLNYARRGNDDCEVDLVDSSPALKPVSALEIKWSDRYVKRPKDLKSLVKFCRKNRLPLVWASTRIGFGRSMIGETELRQWPAAVLAFHYGSSAVRGRLADFDARVEGIET